MSSNKFNLLAINRGSKFVTGCIVPEDGYLFISSDLNSAEPTLLLNYSYDLTLKAVLYDYVGKKPKWENGILLSDNLYITTMSKTSLIKDKIKEIERQGYDFAELWINDNEKARHLLGSNYKYAKGLCLALIYGLGVNGVVRQLTDIGIPCTTQEAKNIYNAFWDSIPAARDFKNNIVDIVTKANKRGIPFLNPFGLPLPSGKPKDALNRLIQSSVSSFVRELEKILLPYKGCRLVAIIHDELIFEVQKDLVDKFKEHFYSCVAKINEKTGFPFPMRLGFNVGDNFYDIH